MNTKIVTNHWGKSFYITEGLGFDLHFAMPSCSPIRFQSQLEVDAFLSNLSESDITSLSRRFSQGVLRNISYIKQAIASGKLNVIPMDNAEAHCSLSTVNTSSRTQSTVADTASPASLPAKFSCKRSDSASDNRSLRTVRAEIRMVLRQIIEQEQLEAKQLEKAYQKRSVFGKARAHVNHLGTGLYNSGESFLTWMKEVDDVVSIHKRLFRILVAANLAINADTDSPYQLYQKLLSSQEKKEIVEALGFDPSLITVEKITEIYSLGKLINDDHATQLILKHFIKDYIDAQHSLEWSEMAGGATFEIILTALLAVATGGAGAIASLGAKAKKLSQMKKLGNLFSELAELLKKVPKPKPSMRKQKEIEDKRERKKEKQAPIQTNKSTLRDRKGVPPKSLNDASNRLKTMRSEIQTNGYKSKYNDAKLAEMSMAGKVANEQYQVRFMPKSYLNDRSTPNEALSGKMGGPFKGKSGEGVKYWSTSFDQLEDADSDPKLISEKVGIKYDPNQEYALVIVDNHKAAQISGTHAITPTFKDLGDFAKQELPDQFDAATIDELYTPEYQAKYNQLYQEADELGLDVWNTEGLDDFSEILENRGDDTKLFEQRLVLHNKLGSNEDFLGNGLTKNLIKDSNNEYGVVETFSFEHTPQNLAALKENGAITIIDNLKPIGIN